MTRTITITHGNQAVPLQFEPPAGAEGRAAVVEAAKKQAAGLAGGVTAEQWTRFEQNLGRWIDRGFEGHLSLERMLSDPAAPRAGMSLVSLRTVGTEHELREVKLSAKDLAYDETLSSTAAMTRRPTVRDGKRVEKKTSWPLMKLTPDQVHGGSGCVEVVFGPLDVTDTRELQRRGQVVGLLREAFRAEAGGKLSDVVRSYGQALAKAAAHDPELAKYALSAPKKDVDVGRSADPVQSVQTNVEVPLRKIGLLGDTSVPDLFGGANEAEDRAMFAAARREANALVDRLFRDPAAGSAFDPKTVKQDKLRAVFTLAIYDVAKVSQQQRKGAWPVLPKIGAADLVREALGVRDKALLFAVAHDPGGWSRLEDALVQAARDVKAERSFGRGVGPAEEKEMREEIAILFQPGNNPARFGDESGFYGKVDEANEDYSGTITGKPIAPTWDHARGELAKRDPKIVLEVRRLENPINAAVEGATLGAPLQGAEGHARLVAAAAPMAPRPRKQER